MKIDPAKKIDSDLVSYRLLGAEDAAAYRALRQHVLDIGDGRFFSDSYQREAAFESEAEWRDWCTPCREHCIVGTFYGTRLIGIMGITQYGGEAANTVEWEMTWLDPAFRNQGIAKQSYTLVEEWTKLQGYDRAVVFIRADNQRSRQIRESQGAVYYATKHAEVWADGSVADVDCFEIPLVSRSERARAEKPTPKRLSA